MAVCSFWRASYAAKTSASGSTGCGTALRTACAVFRLLIMALHFSGTGSAGGPPAVLKSFPAPEYLPLGHHLLCVIASQIERLARPLPQRRIKKLDCRG